jgi:hypothetical protein
MMMIRVLGGVALQLFLTKYPPERLLTTGSLVRLTHKIEKFKTSVQRRKERD